jgi:hypothetical protein
MPNARDYQGQAKKFLVYGRTGAGKSCGLLTHPGKKFAYVFDPAGLESFAGYDVEYEMFVPDMKIKKGKLGKGSRSVEMLRPDPSLYLAFEKDFEDKASSGFFDQFDIIAFESLTTLMDMMMWYILDAQGRGNSAPEIQDYYFRTDGMKNIVRVAAANTRTVYCSAHVETSQDETTKRIETSLFLPASLKAGLPLLFSEVLLVFAETDAKKGVPRYFVQLLPDRKCPDIRTSLKNVKHQEDITVDWSRPPAGQGLFGLYSAKPHKTLEELEAKQTVNMNGK